MGPGISFHNTSVNHTAYDSKMFQGSVSVRDDFSLHVCGSVVFAIVENVCTACLLFAMHHEMRRKDGRASFEYVAFDLRGGITEVKSPEKVIAEIPRLVRHYRLNCGYDGERPSAESLSGLCRAIFEGGESQIEPQWDENKSEGAAPKTAFTHVQRESSWNPHEYWDFHEQKEIEQQGANANDIDEDDLGLFRSEDAAPEAGGILSGAVSASHRNTVTTRRMSGRSKFEWDSKSEQMLLQAIKNANGLDAVKDSIKGAEQFLLLWGWGGLEGRENLLSITRGEWVTKIRDKLKNWKKRDKRPVSLIRILQ